MSALTMEEFSDLHTHLVVPMIVADILSGHETFDDDCQYALHDALSEVDPDTALLTISLSAQHLAAGAIGKIPVAVAVKFEAEKILQEYGSEWLSNYKGGPVNEEALYGTLLQLPEDLEAMADLLDAFRVSFIDENDPIGKLCDILSFQARAHMDIADYILNEIDKQTIEDQGDILDECFPAAYEPQKISGNNIIAFPAHRTRQ